MNSFCNTVFVIVMQIKLVVVACHQCGPGSIPGQSVTCGLSLLLVLVLAPRGFSLGNLVFHSRQNKHFQIPIRSG